MPFALRYFGQKKILLQERNQQTSRSAYVKESAQKFLQMVIVFCVKNKFIYPCLEFFFLLYESLLDFFLKVGWLFATPFRHSSRHDHTIGCHELKYSLAFRMEWYFPMIASEIYSSKVIKFLDTWNFCLDILRRPKNLNSFSVDRTVVQGESIHYGRIFRYDEWIGHTFWSRRLLH